MIWSALNDKLRTRGPVAFAADVAELAVATVVVGVAFASTLVFAAGAIVIGALQKVGHRCDADCATDRTSCRNAEERS